MPILLYQAVIFITIVGSAIGWGYRGIAVTSIFWGVWTVVMIFMPWLMALQIVTVIISCLIALLIAWGRSKIMAKNNKEPSDSH